MTVLHLMLNYIFGFTASLGFGLVSNLPKRALVPASFVGASVWTVYYIVNFITNSNIIPNVISGVLIGLSAEFYGYHFKVSSNAISIPALVSLVPGSGAYQAMEAFFSKHSQEYNHNNFMMVSTVALSITIGFFIAEFIFILWFKYHVKTTEK